MEFAKQQLMKFGWTEGKILFRYRVFILKIFIYDLLTYINLIFLLGKGLGKNEDGISEALKPKLKFDTAGVGHSSSEQFTFNWWENVFNNAAENINVRTHNHYYKFYANLYQILS